MKCKKFAIVFAVIGILLIGIAVYVAYHNLQVSSNTEAQGKAQDKTKHTGKEKKDKNQELADIKYLEDSYIDSSSGANLQERLELRIHLNQKSYPMILDGVNLLVDAKGKQALLLDYIYYKYQIYIESYMRFDTVKQVSAELFGTAMSDEELKQFSYSYLCLNMKYRPETNHFVLSQPGCGGARNPYLKMYKRILIIIIITLD